VGDFGYLLDRDNSTSNREKFNKCNILNSLAKTEMANRNDFWKCIGRYSSVFSVLAVKNSKLAEYFPYLQLYNLLIEES
jgi:hypothetical protein